MISGQSEAAVPGIDWSEVLGWYASPQEEDHRQATSQTKEVRQLRHDMTRHDTTTTLLIISSVHMVKNHCKSVPAQIIPSPHSSLHGSSTGGTKQASL